MSVAAFTELGSSSDEAGDSWETAERQLSNTLTTARKQFSSSFELAGKNLKAAQRQLSNTRQQLSGSSAASQGLCSCVMYAYSVLRRV